MSLESPITYEFDAFRYCPSKRLLINTRNNHALHLMPKANSLLLSLIRRRGEVASYDDLRREVWDGVTPSMQTVRETKRVLCNYLGESAGKIQTVSGIGYQFVGEVRCISDGANAISPEAARTDFNKEADEVEIAGAGQVTHSSSDNAESIESSVPNAAKFNSHHHLLVSCGVYAALYTIALFVEVAYQYDRFGATAWRLAVPVFLWIFTTSLFGLWLTKKRSTHDSTRGLTLTLLVFVSAVVLLYVTLGFFLPDFPVTQAEFQTYTAHGAYLKSAAYFLFIAALFLILPFHFVQALSSASGADAARSVARLLSGRRGSPVPAGTVYLRVWWLGVLLVALTLLSPAMAAHLFENLKPSPYMNLFIHLVAWRTLLYLGLAAECLLWYYSSLNGMKQKYSNPRREVRITADLRE